MVEIKSIFEINDREIKLLNFLKEIDNDFKIPLSDRVDLKEWTKKLLNNSEILVAYKNEILGIIAVYNNREEEKAYITLLAVKENYRKRGITKIFLEILSSQSKEKKIKKICCHTQNELAINKIYLKNDFKVISKNSNNTYYLEKKLGVKND